MSCCASSLAGNTRGGTKSCKSIPPSQPSSSLHSFSVQTPECQTPLCRLKQTAAAPCQQLWGEGMVKNTMGLRCISLTVLRQLHHVVEHGAVAVEGAHPGEHHAAAVGGVQRGHQVLRGVRQLSAEEKGKRGEKKINQHRKINLYFIHSSLTGR